MKLNIGSGIDIREGYINLDITDEWGADIVFDLTKVYQGEKIPFKDNSFEEVIIFDVLEHFIEPLPILKELYRVCKVGGFIEIKVPCGSWVWDNMDHKRQFSIQTFNRNNFDYYGVSGEDKVRIVLLKRYVLPSNNFIFKIARWVFGKTNLYVKYLKIR